MPTYDYHCARCGEMEIFQSIREDALTACPECGSKRFERRISGGAGVIFRGSGFYETDYNRSGDYSKAAKAEAGGSQQDGSRKPAKEAASPGETGGGSSAKSEQSAKKQGGGSAASGEQA